jgi:hypothetical protein
MDSKRYLVRARLAFFGFIFATVVFGSAAVSAQDGSLPTVPLPGQLTKTLNVGGFSFQYPNNWTEMRQGASALAFPLEGVVTRQGQKYFRYGFGTLPIGQYTVYEYNQLVAGNLKPMAEMVFSTWQQANPGTGMLSENAQTAGDSAFMTIAFENDNPPGAPDEPEAGALLLIFAAKKSLQAFVMFAPKQDMEQGSAYSMLYANMLRTVRVGVAQQSVATDGGVGDVSSSPGQQGSSPATGVIVGDVSSLSQQESATLNRIVARLSTDKYRLPPDWHIVVVQSNQFNAFADPRTSTVTVYVGAISILWKDEGELAFLICHELGHLNNQSTDEKAADEVGLMFLIGAGYSPYDAAAMFGRLIMNAGGGTVMEAVTTWLRDRPGDQHPWTIHRIEDLRRLSIKYCNENPGVCNW